jgi:hypothetical protein
VAPDGGGVVQFRVSLTVDVFLLGEDRGMTVLAPVRPGADLAGFERFRTTVWGSDAMRAVGARYFPLLATGDLTVLHEEVPAFLAECALVEPHMARIAAASGLADDGSLAETIAARLANIRAAAERALEVGGGVIIW